MSAGVFITFEGGEGAGKTTQIEFLADRLSAMGRKVLTTREPGGTALGAEIRRLLVCSSADQPTPRAELMLYGADRAHHVERVIRPALARGEVVLCDRFADATLAYQGHGRGIDLGIINNLNMLATGGVRPARTLWIDLDPAEGVSRSLRRQQLGGGERESRFEEEALAFHRRVREGYAAIMAADPGRVRLVPGEGTPGEVAAKVWEAVEEFFA